jgi:hypothetical protein
MKSLNQIHIDDDFFSLGNGPIAGNDTRDAHSQGFYDGIGGFENLYINATNDYMREYNRGHKAGASML